MLSIAAVWMREMKLQYKWGSNDQLCVGNFWHLQVFYLDDDCNRLESQYINPEISFVAMSLIVLLKFNITDYFENDTWQLLKTAWSAQRFFFYGRLKRKKIRTVVLGQSTKPDPDFEQTDQWAFHPVFRFGWQKLRKTKILRKLFFVFVLTFKTIYLMFLACIFYVLNW